MYQPPFCFLVRPIYFFSWDPSMNIFLHIFGMSKYSWKFKRQAGFLFWLPKFLKSPHFKHRDLLISVTFSDLEKLILTEFIKSIDKGSLPSSMSCPLIFLIWKFKLIKKTTHIFQNASRSIKWHHLLPYIPCLNNWFNNITFIFLSNLHIVCY